MTDYPELTQAQKKSFQKLLTKKYRDREKKFLVEGPHVVEEALNSTWRVDQIIMTPAFRSNPHARGILKTAKAKNVKISQLSEAVMVKMSDTVTTQGVVAVVAQQTRDVREFLHQTRKSVLVVALDRIADPGNLGTIIRTCDWFGVDAVMLSKESAELFNSKTLRSTMGSIFHLPIFLDVALETELTSAKRSGYSILATTSSGGTGFDKTMVQKKSVVLFGNEAHGVSSALLRIADYQITIPGFGKAESLNVGISCGIVLGYFRV
jgi:TrmH family RNA methyltransferase